MKKPLLFVIVIFLTLTLISCSSATHEKVAYVPTLKSLSESELEGVELKEAIESLGVNPITAEKLAAPRDDAVKEVFVNYPRNSDEVSPRLVLTSMHTNDGVLFSVDVIWDELPSDRYLDLLGIFFNLDVRFNHGRGFTNAWLYYDGQIIDMKNDVDYMVHAGCDYAYAISYDLGKLTKGMKKDKGALIIHLDMYGLMAKPVALNYNLSAFYDHGTKGYDRNVNIVASNSNDSLKFDIKSNSRMSGVMYELYCTKVFTYRNYI